MNTDFKLLTDITNKHESSPFSFAKIRDIRGENFPPATRH